jgi:hypothetical protein
MEGPRLHLSKLLAGWRTAISRYAAKSHGWGSNLIPFAERCPDVFFMKPVKA